VRRPPDNDADEAPSVPAARRRLGHATALDAGLLLLPFKLRPPMHHTSCPHRGRPRLRQHADLLRHHCVTTTSPCCRSPPRPGLVEGVIRLRRRLRCDQANRENTARSARAPLKNGAAVGRGRLKIATDVAGMLRLSGLSRPRLGWSQSQGRPFVLTRRSGYLQTSA
jgi:hypothetical protein